MKGFLLPTLLLLAASCSLLVHDAGTEQCCTSCALPEIKYYSIVHPRCGESCLDPKDYWKFKIFEPKMAKAETPHPCADYHFTVYEETEVHGAGPLKVAVDLYHAPS
jgi:hypothetical protein